MQVFLILILTLTACLARADSVSIGPRGINATATGLDGTGVLIGQVELRRPGKPGKDSAQFVHEQVEPTQVYAGNNVDTVADSQYVMDVVIGEAAHALAVAGVMVASPGDDDIDGVAPEAQLHSSAMLQNNADNLAISANRLAQIFGMTAINVSLGGLNFPDGTSRDTEFIDWSTQAQEVLYVVAGSYDDVPASTPQDNFNGITVGASVVKDGEANGRYRQVWNKRTLI